MISSKEFCDWLRGFIAGSSKYNVSPEGWDLIRKKLEEVYDDDVLKVLKDPGTFTAPVAPFYPPPYPSYPNTPPTYPYIGDPPGWLDGPWKVVSTTGGDVSRATSTSTGAYFTPPKQESNE